MSQVPPAKPVQDRTLPPAGPARWVGWLLPGGLVAASLMALGAVGVLYLAPPQAASSRTANTGDPALGAQLAALQGTIRALSERIESLTTEDQSHQVEVLGERLDRMSRQVADLAREDSVPGDLDRRLEALAQGLDTMASRMERLAEQDLAPQRTPEARGVEVADYAQPPGPTLAQAGPLKEAPGAVGAEEAGSRREDRSAGTPAPGPESMPPLASPPAGSLPTGSIPADPLPSGLLLSQEGGGGPLPAEGPKAGAEHAQPGPPPAADGSEPPGPAPASGQGATALAEALAPEGESEGDRVGPPSRGAKSAGSGSRGVQSARPRVQMAAKSPSKGPASKGDESAKPRPPHRVDDLF